MTKFLYYDPEPVDFDADAEAMDARNIKEGDRLLIRRDGYPDVVVVVDDVAENEDGTAEITATTESGLRLGSCCYNVGTAECVCETPTNWAAPHIDVTCDCDGDDGETGHDVLCPRLQRVRGRRVTEEDVDW